MYHKQNNMALHKIEGLGFDWMPSTLISNVLFYYCLMQKDSTQRQDEQTMQLGQIIR